MGRYKKGNMLEINRRELLKNSGVAALSFGKMGMLAQAVFDGIFSQAYAQSTGVIGRKYLYIQQYGAPSRWTWDLPLTPDGDTSKFLKCKAVGTRFKAGSRYTEVEYATVLKNGLHMPWMWGFDIPTAGGGWTSMANLMDGMMVMRGTYTNPGHTVAASLHFRPFGSVTTTSALAADVGDSPIPAIQIGGSGYQFQSRKGYTSTSVNWGGNMVGRVMKPFLMENLSQFDNDSQKVKVALERSLASLDGLAKSDYKLAQSISESTHSALEIFKKDFGQLDNIYNTLVGKYRGLISRAMDPARALPGLSDQPIGATNNRGPEYQYGLGRFVNGADVREMINSQTLGSGMLVPAGQFAMMEFLLMNDLSSSINIGLGGIQQLNGMGGNGSHFSDEHGAGSIPGTYLNTSYNMAISSCLFELISQLKAAGKYDNTVIEIGGEFGRIPQENAAGSDHSAEATSNTIFSGAIEGSHVVGNIAPNGGNQPGTWGFQAVNPEFGLLNVGHYAASLAQIIGAQSPVTAVPSIMKLQPNGKLVPRMKTGTIV